jgi:hypothetical protein
MSYLYIVRCNFTRAELERSWNDWYNDQKVAQLLAKPMFGAVQRFQLQSGNGRSYIAVWQVASPDAFKTPQYTSNWGFFDWEQYVTDWSRDLFDAGSTPETALAIAMNGFLQVISFDGLDATAAEAQRTALADASEVMWFKSVGLDRHTPLIGLRGVSGPSTAPSTASAGVQAGIYRPICPFIRAAASASSASA